VTQWRWSRWVGRVGPAYPADWFDRCHLGVVAGIAIAVLVNLFAIRFDRRWDFTSDHRYTPPAALRTILEGLHDDVTVVVLLSRTDPLASAVEQLLSSYRSMTRYLTVDWVDPDRNAVRFLARQSELGLAPGRTEDGRVTGDAVLVVVARGRRYYIEAQDIVGLDPDAADSTSHFEHAIAVALRTVFEQSPPTVCFTEGHRELSISDRSPLGLSRLSERLMRDATTSRSVDLANGNADALSGCHLVVVAAPDVTLSPQAVQRLTQAAAHSSLLLLGGVVPDADGHLTTVGLEPLARLGGISFGADVVVELDSAYRLPNLFGETFFSTPSEHPTTRGLLRGRSTSPLRVVVSLAQSLDKLPGSEAWPLLSSSPKSVTLNDVSQQAIASIETKRQGARSRVVAMAARLEGQRRIVVAPANVLQNRSFETSSLLVTQAFGLSLVSWLLANEASLVDFEPRPNRVAEFELSEQELADIARYTGLVMPACCLLVGVSVLLLRRRSPNRRTENPDEGSS
jgi:hypothetical protein